MGLVALADGDISDAVHPALAGAAAQKPKDGVLPIDRSAWSASGPI